MEHPIQLTRGERAEMLRETLAGRAAFFDCLGPVRGREGRMGAINAMALGAIRDVLSDLEPRNRLAEIGAILDAAELVAREQGPPPAEATP